MTFSESVALAVAESKRDFRVMYIYCLNGDFVASAEYAKGWLLRACPGGRTEASAAGSRLVASATRG